jgi:hypothetical protein
MLIGAVIYLHDPPWLASVTSGLRGWEGPAETRFRWTTGHASFFVPSDATALTLPLKAPSGPPGDRPVTVDVSVDDRWLAAIELPDPSAWVRSTLPLPRKPTSRRFRRIDLRVNRTVGQFSQGVQLGAIELQQSSGRQ